MACLHCGEALEDGTEDGAEVCRFCKPKFSVKRGKTGMYAARCPACAQDRDHDPEDLEVARRRIDVNV